MKKLFALTLISISALGATPVVAQEKNCDYTLYTSKISTAPYRFDFSNCIEYLKPNCGITFPEAPKEDSPTQSPENGITTTQTEKEAVLAAEVISLINDIRKENSLSPLSANAAVQNAAQIRSKEQTKLFSHTRPNGNSCFSVLSDEGISYKGSGENIAYGQKSAEDVVNAWMASEAHRANILSKNFTDIGVGCYISPSGTIYWTQLFIY